jgi:hypothetical protein
LTGTDPAVASDFCHRRPVHVGHAGYRLVRDVSNRVISIWHFQEARVVRDLLGKFETKDARL